MRKIWKLPQQAHCFLLHLISGCLPVFDELCRRSVSLVRSCLSHDSYLIRFVANYAVVHARSPSCFLVTMFYFAHTVTILLLTSPISLVRFIIFKPFVHNSIDDNMRCFANLLYKLIMIRERRLYLNDSVLLTGDVNDIIYYVCTS